MFLLPYFNPSAPLKRGNDTAEFRLR